MGGSGRGASPRARTTTAAPAERGHDLHDRYAAALYRQALLTLANADLAEQVVCDVIIEACARRLSAGPRAAGGPGSARQQLALSAFWRCQEVAADAARARRTRPTRPPGDAAGPGHPVLPGAPELSRIQRGALALVLFGGLGYAEAARVAGISRTSMARLLRTVLLGRTEPADARA